MKAMSLRYVVRALRAAGCTVGHSADMPAEGMAEMRTYQVEARRWARGWELHIAGEGVTQSRSLTDAEGMVRDYIALMHDVAPDSFDVEITPVVGNGLDEKARTVRDMVADADRARREAAVQSRAIVDRLRRAGLSGRDIAHVLGISAQRVSQLLKAAVTQEPE